MTIPILETERLILRPFRQDDLDAYAAMMADPDFTRHLGTGATLSRADTWRQMAMFLGHWTLRGYGFWALERKADDVFIGRAGLLYPEGWPDIEIGWGIGPADWGKGYASEAARAAAAFAFDTLGLTRLISLYRPENAASIRVGEKLGQIPEEEREMLGGKVLIHVLTPERFHAATRI